MNQKTREAGVDEAGRGPVIGPLVFGAVALSPEQRKFLEAQGVKDSKDISRKKRLKLYEIIKQNSIAHATLHYSAKRIDQLRKKMTLNEIEIQGMVDVLVKLNTTVEVIYIDAADVNPKRFGERIQQFFKAKVIARHKADRDYIVVGAASILAKVERDLEIKKIEEKVGKPIGSGYPSDEATRAFLLQYYKKHKSFPEWVRKSWKTIELIKAKAEREQSKLDEFF